MQAQTDTEFWFAVPEVTSLHADRPIYLRISSLNKAATITISQPANAVFPVLTRTIAANSSTFFDLTEYIDLLENGKPDFADNKGLFIKSTSEITAYYEVYGTGTYGVVNTDIFVLKGRNALGTEFYTPFQTYWDNYSGINAWSSFDIVATENNTIVTITPTQNLTGPHVKNVTFSITLNKGQTYSCRAASVSGSLHPAGSHVTSNKPIAITVKDDSLYEQGHWDLAGDQIVPVNIVGKEYVVIQCSGMFDDDRVFICATQNNTDVFIDGNPVAAITLAAGQTYNYKVSYNAASNSTYIQTSQPVYIFHMSSLNGELAGALLPPLACTGSKDIRFSRNITGDPGNAVLKLNIIVKAGKEFYFKLNGNSISTTFDTVHGSGGVWVTAQIIASDAMIPEGSNAQVSNDSADFHLGVTNGIYNKSFEYGYFSDYGSLDLGPDQYICKGGSTELDAGIKDTYLWNTNSRSQSIIVSDSGKYYVIATKGLCTYSDTVSVHFNPEITRPILNNDTAVCASVNYVIKTDTIFNSYLWQNGSSSATLKPTSTGYYSVQVSNTFGCLKTDSIFVTINANPVPHIINIKDDKTFCTDSSVVLDAGAGYAYYLWMNGDTVREYSGKHINQDKYWVMVTDINKCSATDTFETDCTIYIEFPNLITPNGDTLNDVFFIKGLRPGRWSLEVFNRWGDKVYLNESYDNTWNGKHDMDGIYYFHLRHVKGVVNYKGWVEILRGKE
ncbi:MAG TPA: gliding motility-associated C-terminal domain-containing protein [Cytophagaceae bacterium]|nr:gliding motility-associated C-terminal domain-containing protein [Cytophagaceae bacterium]